MIAKENIYVAILFIIIYSNITIKHCSMKAQQHHPRICTRERKGREKEQECEGLTTRRPCTEIWLLQSLVEVVVADQMHQLVSKVLKKS